MSQLSVWLLGGSFQRRINCDGAVRQRPYKLETKINRLSNTLVGPRLEEYATQLITLYHRMIAGSGALWDDVGDVWAGSGEHPAHAEGMEAPCRATLWSQSGHFVMAKTLEVE